MKFKAKEIDKNTFSTMRKEASEVFEGEELQKVLDDIKEIEEQEIKLKAAIDKINEEQEKNATPFSKALERYVENNGAAGNTYNHEIFKKLLTDKNFAAKMRVGYRKRLLLFRILSLTAFLGMFVLALVFNVKDIDIAGDLTAYLLLATFYGIYFLMANTILKCPACGYKMDVLARDSSKHCKRCAIYSNIR